MTPHVSAIWPAFKAAGAVFAGSGVAVFAQIELPDVGAIGNVGIVGAIALVVGRYTFRQLEDYRADLKTVRARNARLEDELLASDAYARAVLEYATRLRLKLIAVGADTAELPVIPIRPKVEPAAED